MPTTNQNANPENVGKRTRSNADEGASGLEGTIVRATPKTYTIALDSGETAHSIKPKWVIIEG